MLKFVWGIVNEKIESPKRKTEKLEKTSNEHVPNDRFNQNINNADKKNNIWKNITILIKKSIQL
jgi:hypothetical protein